MLLRLLSFAPENKCERGISRDFFTSLRNSHRLFQSMMLHYNRVDITCSNIVCAHVDAFGSSAQSHTHKKVTCPQTNMPIHMHKHNILYKCCHYTLGTPFQVLSVGSWGFLVYELGQASFRPHTSCTNSYDGWTNSPQRLARGLP